MGIKPAETCGLQYEGRYFVGKVLVDYQVGSGEGGPDNYLSTGSKPYLSLSRKIVALIEYAEGIRSIPYFRYRRTTEFVISAFIFISAR